MEAFKQARFIKLKFFFHIILKGVYLEPYLGLHCRVLNMHINFTYLLFKHLF